MAETDIINAILASLTFLGIVVALGLGVWSVNETKKLRKKEYAEVLIKRILQWLFATRNVGIERNFSSASELETAYKDGINAKNTFFLSAGHHYNELMTLADEGEILVLELGNTNKQLSFCITKLCDGLISCADYNDKYQEMFLHSSDDILKIAALSKEWAQNDPIKNDNMRQLGETSKNK